MGYRRDVLFYTLVSVAIGVIPYFFIPIFAKLLGPEQYGKYSLTLTFVSFFSILIGIGSHGAVSIKSYELSEDDKIEQYIKSANTLNLLLAILFSVLVYILFRYWDFSISFNDAFICIFIALCQNLFFIRCVFFNSRRKIFSYGIARLSLLSIDITLGLVLIFYMGPNGRIAGFILASLILGIWAITHNLSKVKYNKLLIKDYMLDIVKFGIPLIPHSLLAISLVSVDRFLINKSIGSVELGAYVFAFQFSFLAALIGDTLGRALSPKIMGAYATNDLVSIKRNYIYIIIYGFFMVFIGLAMIPIYFVMIDFTGKDYIVDNYTIIFLILASVFTSVYYFTSTSLFYYKDTWILSINTLIAAAISFLLNYYLIDIFGIKACAFSYLISQFLLLIGTGFYSYKKFHSNRILSIN